MFNQSMTQYLRLSDVMPMYEIEANNRNFQGRFSRATDSKSPRFSSGAIEAWFLW